MSSLAPFFLIRAWLAAPPSPPLLTLINHSGLQDVKACDARRDVLERKQQTAILSYNLLHSRTRTEPLQQSSHLRRLQKTNHPPLLGPIPLKFCSGSTERIMFSFHSLRPPSPPEQKLPPGMTSNDPKGCCSRLAEGLQEEESISLMFPKCICLTAFQVNRELFYYL